VPQSGAQALTADGLHAIIAQAASSGLDATAIAMRVHLAPAAPPALTQAGSPALTIDTHVDLHTIQTQLVNGRHTGELELVYLQLDTDGAILHATEESFQLAIPDERFTAALEDGIRYTKPLALVPKAAELCVVLRDNASGAIGSVQIPLENRK
jgi:hypothetical protein